EFREVRPEIREWTTNPLRMARKTDVLLCVVGATCGKINLGEECAIGRSVAAIRPYLDKLDQFYLYYFMMTLVESLRSGSVGAAQTVISKEMVESVQIPNVPLSEQQRIVGILDAAFDGITTTKANAGQNLQNARALFESHLQSVFADAWQTGELVTLADLATDITDGDHMPPPKALTGVPFITIGNVAKDTRTIDFADTFKVSRDYFDRLKPNKKPQKGDVLYTVTGSFGIPVLLNEHREFCFRATLDWFAQNLK
ncbi:MAG: restriction endonuclease subunit S, partial [Gallionella sp.]